MAYHFIYIILFTMYGIIFLELEATGSVNWSGLWTSAYLLRLPQRKIESLQESRRFKVYGFTLVFGYRITSKTFHTIISYISILSLAIFKNKNVI
ncbi:hypothetical protein TYRP_009070 [Tyrophagus putrescentiae]|nr:hypothetical protein TYRP_009070 [Tyrophagus putrescentiae]